MMLSESILNYTGVSERIFHLMYLMMILNESMFNYFSH